MKKRIAILLTLVLLLGVLAGCGSSSSSTTSTTTNTTTTTTAQTDTQPAATAAADSDKTESTAAAEPVNDSKPVTIKVSHTNKEGATTDLAAKQMEEYAESAEPTLSIEIYGNNQLGGESTVLEAMLSGTVEMQLISTSVLATIIPECYVMNVPFLFSDMDQFWKVVNSDAFKEEFAPLFEAKGLHYIGFINCTVRSVANNLRPIHTPDDMKGLKIRVMEGSVYTDLFTALGCSTSVIPISELYTAIQQGLVNAEDCGISYIVPNKYVEIEHYYTDTNHTYQPQAAVINLDAWNKLSAQQQAALEDGVALAAEFSAENYETSLADYYKTAVEEYDLEIVYLTEEERQMFRDAAAEVIEKYANLNDGCRALYDIIQSESAK